jgi:hypothetical protein
MVMAPIFYREREWAPFIDETPGVPIELMKRDSTDPSLKRAREPHTKMNFISNLAPIESIEYQLNQGRFELKKQIPVKPLPHLL